MELPNNKILITDGASSIGLRLTKRFMQHNNTVIIFGRNNQMIYYYKCISSVLNQQL